MKKEYTIPKIWSKCSQDNNNALQLKQKIIKLMNTANEYSEINFKNFIEICKGKITHSAVADHLKLPYVNWTSAIREG